MFATSCGDRILLGHERQLYTAALGQMVDLLACGDLDFGIGTLNDLQYGAQLVALYESTRALLHPDEPVPDRVAYLDAAIASVYRFMLGQIACEIRDDGGPDHYRTLVLAAAKERGDLDDLPNLQESNLGSWEYVIDGLEQAVLADRDFEMEAHLDADPEQSRAIKGMMGIPTDYYTAVPIEPPDHQIRLYLDALMGLTPEGRGCFLSPDGSSSDVES